MKVLVTGGAGYIGSHAVLSLAAHGHEVVVYDNLSTGYASLVNGFELVVADIRDAGALSAALRKIDAVMHFAASAYVGESVQNPRKYFDNNVVAALNLLNCIKNSTVRHVIFSSTCAVYGIPSQLPITEDTVPIPINPYGVSKLFFENALFAYGQAYGIRSVCLRYFNAAGADPFGRTGEIHDPETHLIPLVLAAAADERASVTVFGDRYPTPDGTCIRDYIHVSDLADAHVLALEYLAGGGESNVLNLGTGVGYSIRQIIATVEKLTGRAVHAEISRPRAGDPPVLVADARRARETFGWMPTRNLEVIVVDAWRWMHRRRALSMAARCGTST
jgi:UDP-glucose-4-epimerase GalE